MARKLLDPGPFSFDQLQLPHATAADLKKAGLVKEKYFPSSELRFSLFSVPTIELIESNFVYSVLAEKIPASVYAECLSSPSPEDAMRALFVQADEYQRQQPAFAEEMVSIKALEPIFAAGGPIDPLIAGPLPRPLSSGEGALFVLDGRHRLSVAAVTGVDELRVYVGTRVTE